MNLCTHSAVSNIVFFFFASLNLYLYVFGRILNTLELCMHVSLAFGRGMQRVGVETQPGAGGLRKIHKV